MLDADNQYFVTEKRKTFLSANRSFFEKNHFIDLIKALLVDIAFGEKKIFYELKTKTTTTIKIIIVERKTINLAFYGCLMLELFDKNLALIILKHFSTIKQSILLLKQQII